jgi:hypothetical protein
MTHLTWLLSAVLLQDPGSGAQTREPTPEPTPATVPADGRIDAGARLDEVELQGGEVLHGRIVREVGNYLEIELEPGSIVGFRTTVVAAVRRGAGPLVTPAAPAVPARDEWFTLYDGAGKAVGWLHSTVRTAGNGSVHVQEEWDFRSGPSSFQVTSLEIADAELRPVSCYFRERVQRDRAGAAPVDALARTSQVLEERIVEARVEGQELAVQRLSRDGRAERRLPWPADATFPLLARTQRGRDAQALECTVFDAAAEELQTRSFGAGRRRTVELGGTTTWVEETVEGGSNGNNVVWRDASARVVHREIAGPGLVAVPSDADGARAAAGRYARPAPFVAEPERRFGLWLPNPAWDVVTSVPGTVSLRHGTLDAAIALVLLDHLGEKATLDAAASAVERMATLVHPDLVVAERQLRTVRGRDAVRLGCRGASVRAKGRAALWVVPWQHGFLVLRCSAAAENWEELEPDFDAVVQRLELAPAAVASLLQEGAVPSHKTLLGDKPRAHARRPAKASGASPAAVPEPPVTGSDVPDVPESGPEPARPRVRVPRDQGR